jgi:hypothetical protein
MKRRYPGEQEEHEGKEEMDEKVADESTPPASPQRAAQASSTLEDDGSPVRAPRSLFAPPAPRRNQMGASPPPRFAGDPVLPSTGYRTTANFLRNIAAQPQPREQELPPTPIPDIERLARSNIVRNIFGNQMFGNQPPGPRPPQPGAKRGGIVGMPPLKGSPFNRKK